MRHNDQKITAELCNRENLLFFPKTAEESIAIQEHLFQFGYEWASGSIAPHNIVKTMAQGLVLLGKTIYTRGDDDATDYLVCSADQFDNSYLSPDRAFMLDLFNKMGARIDALTGEVAALRQQLGPQKLDKSRLENSGGQNAPKP